MLVGREATKRLQAFLPADEHYAFDTQTVAGTLAQTGVSAWYHGASAMPAHRFDVARRGRYVRVQLAGTAALSLPEVQVWTRDTTLYPLARKDAGTGVEQ